MNILKKMLLKKSEKMVRDAPEAHCRQCIPTVSDHS